MYTVYTIIILIQCVYLYLLILGGLFTYIKSRMGKLLNIKF